MKFTIYHGRSGTGAREYRDLAKAATLEDAVDIVLALAAAWGTRDGETLGIMYKGGRSGGYVGCGSVALSDGLGGPRRIPQQSRGEMIRRGNVCLEQKKAEAAGSKKRLEWLRANPGAGDLVVRDEALRVAFGAGDFAAAEARLEELKHAA